MSESPRHDVSWFARLQPKGCLGVSEIMEADTAKPCVLHDSIERLRNDIGVEGYTVGTCEYEIGLRPCWTRFKLIGDLSFSMPSELNDGDGVHINGSASTISLR